jgi:hypothetical protein
MENIMEGQYEGSNDIVQISMYKNICPGCGSEKISFKYYNNKEQADHPLFECKNCLLKFICTSYENRCPQNTCMSTDVKFKYYNNKKPDQPRFECNKCNKLYNCFPQRISHLNGYKKGHVIEPSKHTRKIKECPSCHTSSATDHKFYGCNNNDEDQPRYKCGNKACKKIFTPFKKKIPTISDVNLNIDNQQSMCSIHPESSASIPPSNDFGPIQLNNIVINNSQINYNSIEAGFRNQLLGENCSKGCGFIHPKSIPCLPSPIRLDNNLVINNSEINYDSSGQSSRDQLLDDYLVQDCNLSYDYLSFNPGDGIRMNFYERT